MPHPADTMIREAIANRLLLRMVLGGQPRIVEPYDYGVLAGVPRLFVFQVAGPSASGKIPDWRLVTIANIRELELLDVPFESRRPASYRPHLDWDLLLATVPGAPDPDRPPALALATARKRKG